MLAHCCLLALLTCHHCPPSRPRSHLVIQQHKVGVRARLHSSPHLMLPPRLCRLCLLLGLLCKEGCQVGAVLAQGCHCTACQPAACVPLDGGCCGLPPCQHLLPRHIRTCSSRCARMAMVSCSAAHGILRCITGQAAFRSQDRFDMAWDSAHCWETYKLKVASLKALSGQSTNSTRARRPPSPTAWQLHHAAFVAAFCPARPWALRGGVATTLCCMAAPRLVRLCASAHARHVRSRRRLLRWRDGLAGCMVENRTTVPIAEAAQKRLVSRRGKGGMAVRCWLHAWRRSILLALGERRAGLSSSS